MFNPVDHPDIEVTLAPGEMKIIPRHGRAYHCISVTTDGQVMIGLNNEPSSKLRAAMGRKIHPSQDDFTEIRLLNTGATTQGLVLQTDFGDLIDNRLTLIGGTIPVSTAHPDVFESEADQTIAATSHYDVAADATRRELFLFNNDPTNTLRVRDLGGTSSEGIPLPPKSMLTLTTSAAVRVRNPNAGAVIVAIAQTRLT